MYLSVLKAIGTTDKRIVDEFVSKDNGGRNGNTRKFYLSKKNVEERLGTFILNLSDRYRQRKLSPHSFSLPMSRRDIGNYLGIAVETISRIFSKLQRENILVVDKKEVRILDQHRLCGIAHEEHYPAESIL